MNLEWFVSNDHWKKIGFNYFKEIWFDFDPGPVCYFRLATESDDSVAKFVRLDFYYFVNKTSF